MVMNIMVKTRGVGAQSSRAVIQTQFLSSQVEIGFHLCNLEGVFHLVGQNSWIVVLEAWFLTLASRPQWRPLAVRLEMKTGGKSFSGGELASGEHKSSL